MTKEQFITLLRTPTTVNLNLVKDLEEITERFPYFQNAHLLLAKQYQGHENIRYESYLRKAAAYASDRATLYRLIRQQPVEVIHIQSPAEIEMPVPVNVPEPEEAPPSLPVQEQVPNHLPREPEPPSAIPIPSDPVEKPAPAQPVRPQEILEKRLRELSNPEPDPIPVPAPAAKSRREPAERKPAGKTISDQHTFTEWLRLKSIPVLSSEGLTGYRLPGLSDEGDTTAPAPRSEDSLIDRFIRNEPRIVPAKSEFYSPGNMARQSAVEHEDLISETLARIYARQGNIPKAIDAYRRLSLKLPEKSGYFAALIRELEEKGGQE